MTLSPVQRMVLRELANGSVLYWRISQTSGNQTDWKLSDGTVVTRKTVDTMYGNGLLKKARGGRNLTISALGRWYVD